MIRLFLALLLAFINAKAVGAVALTKAADAAANVLAPHRAVYEITLADRKDGVSVAGVIGRMVFELTGSACEGYTQNIRMVTRITDEEGKDTYSDLRSSTWEKGDGDRFRFTSSHYFNDTLQEMVSGTALRNRKSATVGVKLKRPAETSMSVDGEVLFPTQHSLAILKSAQKGERLIRTRIYDGSEQGQVVYQTVAFIGKLHPAVATSAAPPAASGAAADKSGKNDGEHSDSEGRAEEAIGLNKLASWPVAISYFDQSGKIDSTPSYELSFRLYPNGVSRNLLINYGDFSVRGKLDKLTYLRAGSCK